jgi:hypothetical protein
MCKTTSIQAVENNGQQVKPSYLACNDNKQVQVTNAVEPNDSDAYLEELTRMNLELRGQVQLLQDMPDEFFVFDLKGKIQFSNSNIGTNILHSGI